MTAVKTHAEWDNSVNAELPEFILEPNSSFMNKFPFFMSISLKTSQFL